MKGTLDRMSENKHTKRSNSEAVAYRTTRSGGLTAVDDFTGAAEDGARAVVRDDQGLILTDKPDETAVLIGVSLARQPGILSMEDSLTELAPAGRDRRPGRAGHTDPTARTSPPGHLHRRRQAGRIGDAGAGVGCQCRDLRRRAFPRASNGRSSACWARRSK